MEFHHKNHFIPQFYIRYWADDKSVLIHRNYVSNKKVPKWEKKPIKGIGFYSDLYTDIIEGEETDEIERWFDSEFEAPAKPVIDKVSKGVKLTDVDYRILTRYFFSQHVRTPKFLKDNQDKWDGIADKAIQEVASKISKGDFSSYDKRDNFEGNIHLPIEAKVVRDEEKSKTFLKVDTIVGRGFWLFGIKQYLINTIEILPEYKWSILQAPSNIFWPTSDNPTAVMNHYNDSSYDFKGGVGKAGCEIIFPLTPKHILYTQIGKSKLRYVNSSLSKRVRICCQEIRKFTLIYFVLLSMANIHFYLLRSKK